MERPLESVNQARENIQETAHQSALLPQIQKMGGGQRHALLARRCARTQTAWISNSQATG